MLDFVVFAVTFFIVVTISVVYFYPRSYAASTIPGIEPSDPRDGNLPDIVEAGSLHEFLLDLHQTVGPMVSFWYGPKFAVSIASPELFEEHQQQDPFHRPSVLFSMFEPLIGRGSLKYAGTEGRQRGQLYGRFFSQQANGQLNTVFNEVANDVILDIASQPVDKALPLVEMAHAVVMKSLLLVLFGEYFTSDDRIQRFHRSYKVCWNAMEVSLRDGLPEKGSDEHKTFLEAVSSMHNDLRAVIKQRRAGPSDRPLAFIDVLIENNLTERQILDDSITFVLEGFNTLANTLVWSLYHLCKDQRCQERLYQEVMEVVGHKAVSRCHEKDLVYTHSVISESLRVSVVSPIAARCHPDADIMLGGHSVPAGTPIVHALGVVFQDENLWTEPKIFNPDRFLDKDLKGYAFRPFGFAGGRTCPGQHAATTQLCILLAVLCRAFKFSLVRCQQVEHHYGLVTRPKGEIWLTVEKRL